MAHDSDSHVSAPVDEQDQISLSSVAMWPVWPMLNDSHTNMSLSQVRLVAIATLTISDLIDL